MSTIDLAKINADIGRDAPALVQWALGLNQPAIVTTNFRPFEAVILHLVTQVNPDVPVVWMDNGYNTEATYRFADEVTQRLKLNLHIYRAEMSPAWQETRFGALWEQGEEGIRKYNTINKVEPMQRALEELGVNTWFTGLRRSQSQSRATRPVVELQGGRIKVNPIVDWTNRDVHRYLRQHDLPYHPLWDEGYVSVGDIHTTRRLEDGMTEEETRFFGTTRECGLHL